MTEDVQTDEDVREEVEFLRQMTLLLTARTQRLSERLRLDGDSDLVDVEAQHLAARSKRAARKGRR